MEKRFFFIRRRNNLRAFPGYTSFPGGKVDAGDRTLENALIREVIEEMGIDLKKLEREGVVEKISPLGVAISPAFSSERFETHFFKVVFKQKIEFSLDHGEIAEAQWARPSSALSLYREGGMLLVPPTLRIFQILGENREVEWIDDLVYQYDREREVPMVELVSGVIQLLPLSPTLPPADRTNAFLIGDENNRILVDPAPLDRNEYRKLKGRLLNFSVQERPRQIFLTHHHLDHHQYSPLLAEELGAAFALSEDTHRRIKAQWGENYFGGIPCEYKKQGDEVTRWKGQPVIAHQVPGHDRGQLALIPESRAWAIVGDLIQTVGTVVIAHPEGDMQQYFESLERMIDLKPRVIFPSHGMPLGGVNKLVETLDHRKERERQIWQLLQQGADKEEILSTIYSALPLSLHPLARKTIDAHIDKIHNHGLSK